VFADIAPQLLLEAPGISRSPEYRPLDGMSGRRAEVSQASGMISVQPGVSLEEAVMRPRARAFTSSVALG